MAILSPVLVKDKYTWPSDSNRSRKDPLPTPLYNAIMKVARIRLKNTKMSIAEFVEKIRHKFSSLKTKELRAMVRTCVNLHRHQPAAFRQLGSSLIRNLFLSHRRR